MFVNFNETGDSSLTVEGECASAEGLGLNRTDNVDSDGDFLVTWQSAHTRSKDIFGQRYDSSGNQVGGEFQINSSTAGDQNFPIYNSIRIGGNLAREQY
jgi:hypothetical protein